MKFKVGDKVKVVKKEQGQKNAKIGMYGEILSGSTDNWQVYIKEINNLYWFGDKELELAQFTKSDLKDNHIVIFEDGYKRLWGSITNKDNYKEDLTHKGLKELNINEVWEFDKLVWKREEQILDEVEKKYLSDVIRPFRDRVDGIKKEKHIYGEKIKIYYDIKLNEINYMSLPYFEKGTMYKNMEIYKKYTVKELGLED